MRRTESVKLACLSCDRRHVTRPAVVRSLMTDVCGVPNGDRAALAELDARYGMTLYAIAYTLLLNPDAADVTVAATLREAWRRAASFNAREQTAARWLAGLARKAAQDQLRRRAMSSAYA